MHTLDRKWLKELGLHKENFADLPQGTHPLSWAIQNELITQEAYTQWATEKYQVPAIRAEFFGMAVDFSLIEKFSSLYSWDAHCYPIYMWQNTLFVACLEPQKLTTEQSVCFVIAPIDALEGAWDRHRQWVQKEHPPKPLKSKESMPLPPPPISEKEDEDEDWALPEDDHNQEELPAVPKQDSAPKADVAEFDFSFGDDDMPAVPSKKAGTSIAQTPPPPPALDDFDFSALDTLNESDLPPPTPVEEVKEFTSTKIDIEMNNATSATATIQASEAQMPQNNKSDDLDFSAMVSQSDPSVPSTMPPVPNEPEESLEHEQTESQQIEFTPVPLLSQEDAYKLGHSNPNKPVEQTVTNHEVPSHVPSDSDILEADFARYAKLNDCHDRKGVVAHIFQHLKKDYRKLMWVNFGEDNEYLPQYVHGRWKMLPRAWNEVIDVSSGNNIFKIAYKSGLPFHGEVSASPTNDKYFELWTNNKKPDYATVFPVYHEDNCHGFLVGFSKGEGFEEVSTLKKFENLISICKKSLLGTSEAKAA